MKKQSTLLIVVLVVAVLTLGLFFAAGILLKDKEIIKEPVEKAITDLDNVTYVQYTNSAGTVTLVKLGDKWACEENAELILVPLYVDDRMEVLSHIKGTVVTDVKKSECGLDEPMYTFTIKNAEKTVKVLVGMDEEDELYAMVDGEDTIYSIHDEVAEVLDMEAEEFAEATDDVYAEIIDTEEEYLIEEEYVEDEDVAYEDEMIEEPTEELEEDLPEGDTTEE